MPDLMERMYCSEQIHIPPTFPYIMKLYCKAAIRTQPYDLLKWSAAYFRALANGETPPAKERIEYPPYDTPTGLTPGYLKVLIKQMGKDPLTVMSAQTLFNKWNGVCLDEILLIKLLALMGSRVSFNWLKFVAVAAGTITGTLTQTMILLCELLTDEPEGGMATIPLDVFTELYSYLAFMECGPLSCAEIEFMEAIEPEEDISVIAERIRSGFFGGEYGEDKMLRGEGHLGVGFHKDEEMQGGMEEETARSIGSKDYAAIAEAKLGEAEETFFGGPEEAEEQEKSERTEESRRGSDYSSRGGSEISSVRSPHGTVSDVPGREELAPGQTIGRDVVEPVTPKAEAAHEEKKQAPKEEEEGKVEEEEDQVEEAARRKINLDDLDEAIARQIEEKLAEDEESTETEGDFDTLGSRLLGASARSKKYTANEIGYRIFRKYLRQEVPGIGSYVDKTQVEKVIDFMDFWSHKQEGLVMPRNIRHWMCPPLDPVPVCNL